MQSQMNTVLNLVETQQTIGMRRLVRFGVTMGTALAGQILVTLLLGALGWLQQHAIILVFVELVWWPPFFCILYFSFIGVVKLVEQNVRSQNHIHKQFATVCQEYEERCAQYEQQLQEKDRYLYRVSRSAKEKVRGVRLEPMSAQEA